MSTEKCDYLLPDYFEYIAGGWPNEHPECLLAKGHEGGHLVCFSDSRYFLWSQPAKCDCAMEDNEIGCTCFDYEEILPEKAMELIKKEGPG